MIWKAPVKDERMQNQQYKAYKNEMLDYKYAELPKW